MILVMILILMMMMMVLILDVVLMGMMIVMLMMWRKKERWRKSVVFGVDAIDRIDKASFQHMSRRSMSIQRGSWVSPSIRVRYLSWHVVVVDVVDDEDPLGGRRRMS